MNESGGPCSPHAVLEWPKYFFWLFCVQTLVFINWKDTFTFIFTLVIYAFSFTLKIYYHTYPMEILINDPIYYTFQQNSTYVIFLYHV